MLLHLRRQQDEEDDSSADGRLRRIEKLVEEVLIFNEDQEREIKYVKEETKEILANIPKKSKAGSRPPPPPTEAPRGEVQA